MVSFSPINLEKNFNKCVEFRRDSFECSFGNSDGYETTIGKNGSIYFDKIKSRSSLSGWYYYHIFFEESIIGQLEFKNFSFLPQYGYVHLYYLDAAHRGKGHSRHLNDFVVNKLMDAGCKGAILSVSAGNERAIKFYEKFGWHRFKKNIKHDNFYFYRVKFPEVFNT